MSDDDDCDPGTCDPGPEKSRIESLAAEALRSADPEKWVRGRIEEARERLDQTDASRALVQEAKRQLFTLEKLLLRAVSDGSGKLGMIALAYFLVGGAPLS